MIDRVLSEEFYKYEIRVVSSEIVFNEEKHNKVPNDDRYIYE